MAKRNRRSRERAGGRTLRRFAAAALIFLIPPGLGADSLNLTTWYPAPYGVYSQLRSTGNSYFAYQGGSVGIGTTSPNSKLEVANGGINVTRSDGVNTFLAGKAVSNWSASRVIMNLAGDGYNASGIDQNLVAIFYRQPTATTGQIEFLTNVGGGLAEKMRIQADGNVGIGTASPTYALDVQGGGTNATGRFQSSVGANAALTLQSGSTTGSGAYAGLNLVNGTGSSVSVYTQANNGSMSFQSPSGTDRVTITNSGNVGIGTTIPAARLQVGNSGDGTVALANAWNTFSSRRYKENVRPIGGALGKISRLRGVEFEWKGSGKRDLGVVAEEVGRVFPEIVDYETGGRDARGLDYSKLVAPLIEAVKDQQEEIQALRNLIDTQKEAINDQRQQSRVQSARIEALEKTLAEVRKK